MYLYMCSFLETKSVALSRGRPPQVKRKGMPLESAPFKYQRMFYRIQLLLNFPTKFPVKPLGQLLII